MIDFDLVENILIVLGGVFIIGTIVAIGWHEARGQAQLRQEQTQDEKNPARLNQKGA